MGVRGDGIAAHRFRADAQSRVGATKRNRVGGLGDRLDPRAADALDEQRWRRDRGAAIEADVTRQHVGVKARLRH